jgi:hypothetical protein
MTSGTKLPSASEYRNRWRMDKSKYRLYIQKLWQEIIPVSRFSSEDKDLKRISYENQVLVLWFAIIEYFRQTQD